MRVSSSNHWDMAVKSTLTRLGSAGVLKIITRVVCSESIVRRAKCAVEFVLGTGSSLSSLAAGVMEEVGM